ncbi:MAG: hypothetical protein MUF74_02550 [Cypionkella sp.]|nr:hypothetical protein [Cypionkella sp.]
MRALLFPLCLCLALPLAAEEAPAPAVLPAGSLATDAGAGGALKALVLAHDLYRHGLVRRDAQAMIAAARIAGSIAQTEGAPLPQNRTGAEGGTATPPSLPDAAEMLEEARRLAGEDDLTLMLVEATERTLAAAPDRTVTRRAMALPRGAEDSWQVPFFGAAEAELAVIGDGAADLDIRVTDAAGAVVCRDLSAGDRLFCAFTPAENSTVTVTIANPGAGDAAYLLLTN